MAKPFIIGLTGGIGMGKSATAKILSSYGYPIYDADKVVHMLLEVGGKAVKPVGNVFPQTMHAAKIDRERLGSDVFNQPEKLRQLEAILHPLVRQAENAFLRDAQRAKARAVVLEIPLLFETGGESRCDLTLCVTAPRRVQQARVMQRKGMTAARFKSILAQQMKNAERKRRADYVIDTGTDRAHTKRQLEKILRCYDLL